MYVQPVVAVVVISTSRSEIVTAASMVASSMGVTGAVVPSLK